MNVGSGTGQVGDQHRHELVERGEERAALAALATAVVTGRGGIVLVEGVPGIGKTRLLHEGELVAAEAGVRVLRAQGSELEEGFAFGVVRQLLEPVLRSASPERRARLLEGSAALASTVVLSSPAPSLSAAPAETAFAAYHGLYWLLVNLSLEAPLLLQVDDLQWVDDASQRFLVFASGRLGGLRLGLTVAVRSAGGPPGSVIVELAREPGAVTLRPGPLSPAGMASLVAGALGVDAEERFVRACREATGGVPFYACELLRELARDQVEPSASVADRIAHVRPESVVRSVVARVAHASDDGAAIARALAVLGDGASHLQIARLADVDPRRTLGTLTRLQHVGVLSARGVGFAHPIVAASLYNDIPTIEREDLHRRAAALLLEEGAPLDRVAAHLLRAPAGHDARAVDVLRGAADRALDGGGATEAVHLLRRALAEPVSAELRPRLLFDLGAAELAAGDTVHANEHLQVALDTGHGAPWWGEAVLALAQGLMANGQIEAAVGLLDDAATKVQHDTPQQASRLHLALLAYARVTLGEPLELALLRQASVRATLEEDDTPSGRLLHGAVAAHDVLENVPAAAVTARARRAWGTGDLLTFEPPGSYYYLPILVTLVNGGDLDGAEEGIETLLAESRRRGSGTGFATARMLRALLGLRRGNLLEAEADAFEALTLTADHFPMVFPMAVWLAVETLVERGEITRAQLVLTQHEIPPTLTGPGAYDGYLIGRGLLALVEQRWRVALDDFLMVGRRMAAWQARSPVLAPWRSRAALAAARLGDGAEARRLAAEEVELADAFGSPHTRAVALRAAALVAGGRDSEAFLEQAVEVVDGTPFQLETARVLTDLGALQRRRGRTNDARDHLRRGLDLAVRCGAVPIAELARRELHASGARPRRSAISGVDALTATERRVCALAAAGLSNRDIAQELFVTVKAVELHLTASYRKLNISSRAALAGLFPAGP